MRIVPGMPCELEDYGVVVILGGERDRMIGYYDDDASPNKAIVLLGSPSVAGYIIVPRRRLRRLADMEAREFFEFARRRAEEHMRVSGDPLMGPVDP